jgi:hypothetical protein
MQHWLALGLMRPLLLLQQLRSLQLRLRQHALRMPALSES